MNEIKPLLDLLGGEQGWPAQVVTWIGALRLAAKPFGTWIQGLFTTLVAKVLETPEPEDDALVLGILKSWPYRLLSFLVDWLTSIKLPTTDSLKKHAEETK